MRAATDLEIAHSLYPFNQQQARTVHAQAQAQTGPISPDSRLSKVDALCFDSATSTPARAYAESLHALPRLRCALPRVEPPGPPGRANLPTLGKSCSQALPRLHAYRKRVGAAPCAPSEAASHVSPRILILICQISLADFEMQRVYHVVHASPAMWKNMSWLST